MLLDTSYSMGFGDRWESARAAAHAAIAGLSASDRGSVVLFSSGADIAVRSTPERAALTAAVATAKPGAGATRYAPALKVAGSILAESTLPRREVVLISDFQRTGWRGEEGARLPQGAVLTPVPVQGGDGQANLSVTGVSLARSTFSNQERVTVTAGMINRTERPVTGSSITLEVGGMPVGTKPVHARAGGSDVGDVRSGHRQRAQHARHRAARRRCAGGRQHVPLRGVAGRAGPPDAGRSRQRRAGLYLSRALAIGDSPRFETVDAPGRRRCPTRTCGAAPSSC